MVKMNSPVRDRPRAFKTEQAPATSILSLPEGESLATGGSRTGFYTMGIQPGWTRAGPGPPTRTSLSPSTSIIESTVTVTASHRDGMPVGSGPAGGAARPGRAAAAAAAIAARLTRLSSAPSHRPRAGRHAGGRWSP